MTRKEAERQTRQADTLCGLGFTREEAEALRRISMTLWRWYEHECNGTIQRDETDGRPYYHSTHASSYADRRYGPIPDRERGAERRLQAIIDARNARAHAESAVATYLQSDPRGCALYILRPGDILEGGDPSAYYSRGIAVY